MKKNKTLKRVLLVTGTAILLIVLFVAGYMIKARSEMKKMKPADTKELMSNLFAVKDSFVNLYLIKDNDTYIAIDAGNDAEAVAGELKKLGINPDKITAILLTHTDGDHVAAVKLFTNATTYLSADEEQLLNGKKSRFLFFGNKIDTQEYSLVTDRQVFNIGNTVVKGILTPGHTPGSMCYLVNDKYLFTGDALSLQDGKIDKFNELFNMDTETAVKSTGKLLNLPGCEYIFTAHYGYADYNNAIKDLVKQE